MKKSKILVPALAVLALGMAGAATGTVAWYQVTAKASVKTATAEYAVSSATSTVTVNAVEITVTLTPGGNVELLNSAGKTGAIIGGNPVVTDPSGESTKYIQSISASAVFTSTPSSEQLAALANHTWDGEFTAVGNAKLVSTATSYADPASELTGTYRISFGSDGSISGADVLTNGYFKINTNNPSGLEYKVSDASTAPVGQVPDAYDSSESYVAGDVVLQSSKVYKAKEAATGEFDESKWERIDHGADQLVVTADAGSNVND